MRNFLTKIHALDVAKPQSARNRIEHRRIRQQQLRDVRALARRSVGGAAASAFAATCEHISSKAHKKAVGV